MKKIFYTLLVSVISLGAFAQNNFSKIVEKYRGQDDVNFISINNSMIQFGANFIQDEDQDAQVVKKMADQVNGISIVNTCTKEKGEKLSKEIANLIKKEKFEELMAVDSEGEKVKFYGKIKNEKITELFLLVEDKGEFTLIGMTGNIDPKDVGEMIQNSKNKS